jgi:hypothetical protein
MLELNIKYPLIFITKLSLYIDNYYIDDDVLRTIIKIYLDKFADEIVIYNIKYLFINKLDNYPKSSELLNKFYSLYLHKLKIIYFIQKWYKIYNKKSFWKLSIENQILYLENMRNRFYGIYEIHNGNNTYILKIIELLNCTLDRYTVIENIKERLLLIYKIFGYKIFEALNIPIIFSTSVDDACNDAIIYYIKLIYDKINKLLDDTLLIFNLFKNINNEIDLL